MDRFVDRSLAGHLLAARLLPYAEPPDVIIVARSPAGLPVAEVLAWELTAPLYGLATLADGAVANRQVILTDDGLADADALTDAIATLRAAHPRRLVIALPVASAAAADALRAVADEVITVLTPARVPCVADWYVAPPHRRGATDDPHASAPWDAAVADAMQATASARPVTVPADHSRLSAVLTEPTEARGLALLAYLPGTDGAAERRAIRQALHASGVITLELELLDDLELADGAVHRARCADLPLLAERVLLGAAWLGDATARPAHPLAAVGIGPGAAPALLAATRRPDLIDAVVAIDGYPDAVGCALTTARTPALLLAEDRDRTVVAAHHHAMHLHDGERHFVLLPSDDADRIARTARLTAAWIGTHLALVPTPADGLVAISATP